MNNIIVHALFTNNGVNVCEHVMNSVLFTTTHNDLCGDAWRGQGGFVYSWCKIKNVGVTTWIFVIFSPMRMIMTGPGRY